MTRRALLVGNSVTYTDVSKSITRPILERTIGRLKALLAGLEPQYAFDVSVCIDERGNTVLRKLEEIATRVARDGDLLLVYYFGHGEVSSDLKLLFLHRGARKGEHDRVRLEQLETRVSEEGVSRSLFLLDCCYAGGMRRTFPHTLKGNHCRIAATAPASKAYVVTGTVVDPIGAFTQALMESFTTPEACISIGDNRVTTTSLFEFLQREIAQSDRGGVQKPTIEGSLTETLFEYRAVPSLRAEYSHWADEKTAYAKIVVICRALSEENFQSLFALHRYLVRKYSRSFQTLFKQ